ncbi:hypothetical protein JB92DRAFT_2976817, partial [Gautieria morchelliformis]
RSTGMSIVFGECHLSYFDPFLPLTPSSPDTQVVEESTFNFCTRARVRIARDFRWEVLAGQEGKVEGRWWP